MLLTLTASLLIGAAKPDFPVGSYRADLSKAPARGRDVLRAYFGRAFLVISPSGDFALSGIRQRGYWRRHGSRYVFVYDGFFGVQSTNPAEVLKKAWPSNRAEGFVLRPGAGGTLTMGDWGMVRGPVMFRPLPHRTMTQLLLQSDVDGDLTAAAEEALTSLKDRVATEWPEVLRYINDPKRTWSQRSWAAIVLDGVKDTKCLEQAADLILNLKPTSVKGRDATIRNRLARAVARFPSRTTADTLLVAADRGLLPPSSVAPALAAVGTRADIKTLMSWLGSKGVYDRKESLEALTVLDALEALPLARELAADPSETVQLAATGLIARLSPDAAERKNAVFKLGGWLKSSDFLLPMAAVDALCKSKSPDALPYIVGCLSSDMRAFCRRNAATALGNLGDLRAVPALIEAVNRKNAPGSWAEESEVRRAAAEALAKLHKLKSGA